MAVSPKSSVTNAILMYILSPSIQSQHSKRFVIVGILSLIIRKVLLVSSVIYDRTKKRSAIIRNNRSYLSETVQPSDEFINSLFYFKCITEEQRHNIQRQHLQLDKNAELLHIVGSFDDSKFSTFVKCLRQTNQTAVARIVRNGGG